MLSLSARCARSEKPNLLMPDISDTNSAVFDGRIRERKRRLWVAVILLIAITNFRIVAQTHHRAVTTFAVALYRLSIPSVRPRRTHLSTIGVTMRFARHLTTDGPKLAVLDDAGVLVDLPTDAALPQLLSHDGTLADMADAALRSRASVTEFDQANLLAPLDPPTFRDFSTFPEHTAGIVKTIDPQAGVPPEFWDIPTFYFSNPYAILGPYDDVPIPPGCKEFDYELEVAAVVGSAGRDLTAEEGESHIAGFIVINDFSARDIQFHEMRLRLGPAKGKDSATALGTLFVTAHDILPWPVH
jgi:2-keto-4-pentenoate hydratase/2-oxohepta-3-ene-1,7-dioic acid hydratase in catechol pathway